MGEKWRLKFPWPGTGKDTDASRARFDRRMDDLQTALHNAGILGVDKVRVFTGSRVANPESEFPRIAEVIGGMAEVAGKHRISLAIENEASCNVATSAELAGIMSRIPSRWVGLNWDPQNAREVVFPDGYNLLPKRRILNVQIKGKGVMPASDQKLDWKSILEALQKDNYAGRIGLETHIFDGTLIPSAHISMKEILRIVGELS